MCSCKSLSKSVCIVEGIEINSLLITSFAFWTKIVFSFPLNHLVSTKAWQPSWIYSGTLILFFRASKILLLSFDKLSPTLFSSSSLGASKLRFPIFMSDTDKKSFCRVWTVSSSPSSCWFTMFLNAKSWALWAFRRRMCCCWMDFVINGVNWPTFNSSILLTSAPIPANFSSFSSHSQLVDRSCRWFFTYCKRSGAWDGGTL